MKILISIFLISAGLSFCSNHESKEKENEHKRIEAINKRNVTVDEVKRMIDSSKAADSSH